MSSSLTPAEVYNDIFSESTYNTSTLYVPYGTKETISETEYWNKFAAIEEHNLYRKQYFDLETIAAEILTNKGEYLDKFTSDVDFDGFKDVADIVGSVNLILGNNISTSAPKKVGESRQEESEECLLYIEPFNIGAGEEKAINVLVENAGKTSPPCNSTFIYPRGLRL